MTAIPFRITGPTTVSFSGGRTSAYMLWRILDAWDGKLPEDVHVTFANTGREMPATLDFVNECATRWCVRVVWLEYRRDPETGRVWTEEVSHNSASRNGEPFEMMLGAKQILPNPVMRFCTEELKIRTMKRWVQSERGWTRWRNQVGLRSDELNRVEKAGRRNAARKERFFASCPLAKHRIVKGDVMEFWTGSRKPKTNDYSRTDRHMPQGFDLMLRGKWEGNCDLCFLKSLAAKRRMIQDYPDRAEQWAADEERPDLGKGTINPAMGFYRADVPDGYRGLVRYVRQNPMLDLLDPEDDGMDPFANCDGGCGV